MIEEQGKNRGIAPIFLWQKTGKRCRACTKNYLSGVRTAGSPDLTCLLGVSLLDYFLKNGRNVV